MASSYGCFEGTTLFPEINITDTTRSPLPVSVLVCTGLSGSLSMLGAFIIFISFCMVDRNILNQTRWLLLWLTIADFLNCSGIMIGVVRYSLTYSGRMEAESDCLHSNSMCVIQSVITTFSSMSSFFWTIYIGIHLSVSVVKQGEFASRRCIQIAGHLVCWGIPLSITTVALMNNVLGETFSTASGPWCWIRDCLEYPLSIIWMAIAGKGWEIIMYLTSLYLYGHFKWFIRKQREAIGKTFKLSETSPHARNEDEIYAYLPLVLYLLRMWGTIRFIMTICRHEYDTLPEFDTADTVLLHFQSIGDSFQAFCNCILFCLVDKTVRKALISRLTCRNNHFDDDETRGLLGNAKANTLNYTCNDSVNGQNQLMCNDSSREQTTE